MIDADDPAYQVIAPEPAPTPIGRRKVRRDQIVKWRELGKIITRFRTGKITRRELRGIAKARKLPVSFGDLLYLCTKTFIKLTGSRAKNVSGSLVYKMMKKHHDVIFSTNISNSIKRGLKPSVREEIRGMMKQRHARDRR